MKVKKFTRLRLRENEERALQELKQRLLERFPDAEVILYGSKARGDDEEFSDIDLLILVDCQVNRGIEEEITDIKYRLELKYDVIFGTIIENRNFWKSPLANAMPLHWNIDKEGVAV